MICITIERRINKMYITFEMLKYLTIDSYEPYQTIDAPNGSIYMFKCQNDIIKTVGVTDPQLYSDLVVINDEDDILSPYPYIEERISSKYKDTDIFRISHMELYPKSVSIMEDILNGKSEGLKTYFDTVMYTIYLEKIDGDLVSIEDLNIFFSLNSYKDFVVKSLERCLEMFGELKSSSIYNFILDILYTITLHFNDMRTEFKISIDYNGLKTLYEKSDLAIAAISYIAESENFGDMSNIIKILKSVDFDDMMAVQEVVYKDILSYTKYESDKLSIYDAISRLPYNNPSTAVIKDVFPEMPLFSIDDIMHDPDFLSIVLDSLDFNALKTTVSDMLYFYNNIYIIPGNGDDDKYYFYNGSVSNHPILNYEEFVESITNKKIYRQLTRVMRMRNHYTRLIKIGADDWAFFVLSKKSYFKDYEDDEDISEWLDEDDDNPVSRILAVIGQRDGQQYSIIRKIF